MNRKKAPSSPKTKRVLIVDDDVSLTEMMKNFLEEHSPYDIIVENSSPGALERARDVRPDLIILDIVIPALGGNEVYDQLRQDKLTQDIPVVFMTSIIRQDEAQAESGLIGGRKFLAKPLEFQKLIDFVEEHVL